MNGDAPEVPPPTVIMIGLGGPTFITDWAKAVSRFARVIGIYAVSDLPPNAQMVGPGVAVGAVEGFDTYFVRRRRLTPGRIFWRVNGWLEARALLRAVRVAGAEAARAVHSHFYSMGWPVHLVARRLGLPHLHTEHSSRLAAVDPRLGPSRAGRRNLVTTLARVDELFVVSASLADSLSSYGVTRPVHVVSNPVDERIFYWAPGPMEASEPVRLVTIGALIARKDHLGLLESIAMLRRTTNTNVHLTIIGEGELAESLQTAVRRLGLGGTIEFTGWLDRASVASILRNCHLYVHAAHAETFGVAIAEAMLCGLPIVARRAGGLTETITPDQGVTVLPGVEAMTEALAAVIPRLSDYSPEGISTAAANRFSVSSVASLIRPVYWPHLTGGSS